MAPGLALLDRPHVSPTGEEETLCLLAGGTAWSVPLRSVRGIEEAGPTQPCPLTAVPVAGITGIDGRPVLRIDLPGRESPADPRFLVAVATRAGDLAIAADAVQRSRDAPTLDLGGLLPWSGGFGEVRHVPPFKPPAAPTLALMLVRAGGEVVALRTERLEQVDRPEAVLPLPGSASGDDCLAEVAGTLLAARPIAAAVEWERALALILRGDDGRRIVLLVDRALGVETCPADRLVAVRHADDGESLWWRRGSGHPVRVVDPGSLFGWPSAPLPPVRESAGSSGVGTAPPEFLFAETAGIAVAIPLPLVRGVTEPPERIAVGRAGRPVFDAGRLLAGGSACATGNAWLELAGLRGLLHADRILPLAASAIGWQPLGVMPPAAAALFDAAGWDAERSRWVFRLCPDALSPSTFLLLRRAFAASRVGWTDA